MESRRKTPEISPEQYDELEEHGTVTISDGNGRRKTLIDRDAVLTRDTQIHLSLAQAGVVVAELALESPRIPDTLPKSSRRRG